MTELTGLRAMVVEDEGPVALLVEDMLMELGCEVVASAAEVERACALARTATIDVALLDLNLAGKSALPVAHVLRERGIPFVFSTGYGVTELAAEFRSQPTLAKPFRIDDLERALMRTLGRS